MLDALRRGAQSWVAKMLFAVLIVSFGIFWNIGDVIRGFGQGSIAKVGSSEITIPDFQRAFQNEIANQGRETGKRLSSEEARAAGLDRLTLSRLINDTALANHTKELKLALSSDDLVANIQRDENLHGPDGKFSKTIFNEVLHAMGLSEAGFLALMRKDELRRQVIAALTAAVSVPEPLVEAQHAWSEETRKIEHFRLAPESITVAEPDDTKLKETYEANLRQFVVPEYRKIAALVLTVDDLKKEIIVSDEKLKEDYERTKDSYDTPERRRVQQIAFKDKTAAEEGKKALAGGKTFRDVAKDAGATEADINLGMVTKKQLIDKIIAEAAFKLERDTVSEVIEGRFKPVILRVIEIVPGKVSTFDDAKEKIRDRLAAEQAATEIHKRYDLVEENKNLGKTPKEIADALKLKLIEVEAADRTNLGPDGKAALDHPDAQTIVDAAFSAETGLDREAIELNKSNGYAWVNVISVTPEKQKSFDDAKAAVKPVYMDIERKRLVGELATKLVERVNAGDDFAKIAADGGGKREETEAITRRTLPPGLNETAVTQAFALAKGTAGSTATIDNNTRVVYRIMEVTPAAPPSPLEKDKLTGDLKRELQGDLLNAYITALQARQGVSIDQAVLKRATGADAQ